MNVRMVKEAGLYVCPYCNRGYISSRGGDVSGAQLDHFFAKTDYPVFALSLYNLVPSCGDCNRVKSNSGKELLSPFDSTADWNDIKFSYIPLDIENNEITIKTTNPKIQNNIDEMKIREAYQIHGEEVNQLIEKKKMYEQSQIDEFGKVLEKANMTEGEYQRMIFGPKITDDMLKRMPLGRLKKDLMEELKIYT